MGEAPNRSPLQKAYALAKEHCYRIVPVKDRRTPSSYGDYVTAYVIYRLPEPNALHGERVGRRRNPAALLRLMKTLTTKENVHA